MVVRLQNMHFRTHDDTVTIIVHRASRPRILRMIDIPCHRLDLGPTGGAAISMTVVLS